MLTVDSMYLSKAKQKELKDERFVGTALKRQIRYQPACDKAWSIRQISRTRRWNEAY